MYEYLVIKEDPRTGQQGKRTRKIYRRDPLEVGGLYMHLGHGFPGAYRVLKLIGKDE